VKRRSLLVGLGAAIGTAALEAASLAGTFDHAWLEATGALPELDGELAKGAVIHVGHSTHLVAIAGLRMLTDPWFYDPAFGALSHGTGPAAPPDRIGDLDAILISHDHPDHADLRALDRLDKRATVLVATGDLAARVRRLGYGNVQAMAAGESIVLRDVAITATEAVHDVREIGFALQGAGRCVYFAGDTALFDGMAAIGERFCPDLAILPIDGTRVLGASRWVMTPEEASSAAKVLGARAAMSSHADAVFSDRLAGSLLASTVEDAALRFAESMHRSLPHVPFVSPIAGQLIAI
jgi:L-ascorbate metabolism protein UlaG (beta-lactamase superfamily)